MKGRTHLILNVIIISIISFIFYVFFNRNVLNLNLIHLILAVYVFSNLPDIDSSTSIISRTFFVGYLLLGIFGVYNMLVEKSLIGIFEVLAAVMLGYYHYVTAEDSPRHRKFPHTFTFGIIASIPLWIFTSFPIFVIGLSCFILHLAEDDYIQRAWEKDKKLWSNFFRKSF